MSHGIGTIHVRRQRGTLTVQGFGVTPRGTQFIRKTVPLPDHQMPPKTLKKEIAAAITDMLAQEALPL